jgi:membrane protein
MWISSQVVLLGAEVNSILEHKSPEGKRRGAKSLADAGPSAASDEEEQRGTGRPVLRRRPEEEPRPPEGYH